MQNKPLEATTRDYGTTYWIIYWYKDSIAEYFWPHINSSGGRGDEYALICMQMFEELYCHYRNSPVAAFELR